MSKCKNCGQIERPNEDHWVTHDDPNRPYWGCVAKSKQMKYYECFVARVTELHYSRVVLAENHEEAELKFQAWLETPAAQSRAYVRDEEYLDIVTEEVGPMEYQVQLDEDP